MERAGVVNEKAALRMEGGPGAPLAVAPIAAALRPRRSLWSDARHHLARDGTSISALVILGLLLVLACSADFLSEHFFQWSYSQQDLLNNYASPTLSEPALWLGTDELGRSQIVRMLYGARISLAVGFGAALINLTVGVVIGLSAGYFSGIVDDVVQFIVSTLESIPTMFLLLLISAVFRPGPIALVFILGALFWPRVTLYVRGQALSLRERDFIALAGRAVGASSSRLIFRHLLPNVLPLVVVIVSSDIGYIILTESALSYLGLGINPPIPSWGNMLSTASANLERGPWLVWAPGAAIFLTVLSLYLLGDGLRDALDPRSNR